MSNPTKSHALSTRAHCPRYRIEPSRGAPRKRPLDVTGTVLGFASAKETPPFSRGQRVVTAVGGRGRGGGAVQEVRRHRSMAVRGRDGTDGQSKAGDGRREAGDGWSRGGRRRREAGAARPRGRRLTPAGASGAGPRVEGRDGRESSGEGRGGEGRAPDAAVRRVAGFRPTASGGPAADAVRARRRRRRAVRGPRPTRVRLASGTGRPFPQHGGCPRSPAFSPVVRTLRRLAMGEGVPAAVPRPRPRGFGCACEPSYQSGLLFRQVCQLPTTHERFTTTLCAR